MSSELLSAIGTKWASDATLNAIGSLWLDFAPANTPYPYAVVKAKSEKVADSFSKLLEITYGVTFVVYYQGSDGESSASAAGAKILTVFHGSKPSMPGGAVTQINSFTLQEKREFLVGIDKQEKAVYATQVKFKVRVQQQF